MQTHTPRNITIGRLLMLVGIATLAQACTAGYITNQDGSQWNNSGVVTITGTDPTDPNLTTSYTVLTSSTLFPNTTTFSFDPYKLGSSTTNNAVAIPNGYYDFYLVDANASWQSPGHVKVDNTGACPYADAYTGHSPIGCQLFKLVALGCNQKAAAPYPSGNFVVVELQETVCPI